MWLLYLREKDCFSLHAGWLVGASITWFHSWRQGSLWLSGNHGCTIAWRTWSSFTWRYTHMKPFLPMLALWLLSYTCTMYWYSFRDSLDWLFVICVVFLQFQPKKTSHQTIINCQRFNAVVFFRAHEEDYSILVKCWQMIIVVGVEENYANVLLLYTKLRGSRGGEQVVWPTIVFLVGTVWSWTMFSQGISILRCLEWHRLIPTYLL